MAELTGSLLWYKSWKVNQGKEANLSTDTFKMFLCGLDYTPDLDLHTQLSDIFDEVGSNGYSRQTLQNVVWGLVGSVSVFSFDPVVFEATDEDLEAKIWGIYDDTTTDDLLVCCGLLNGNGSPVTLEQGNEMTISFVGGLYSLREEE